MAAPSKKTLIHDWFVAHPDALEQTGRELEKIELPFGVTATYKMWNEGKKEFGKSGK